jgi:hypothetical protein
MLRNRKSGYAVANLEGHPALRLDPASASIAVRYTDIPKAAGITFLQDSTQTDQRFSLYNHRNL